MTNLVLPILLVTQVGNIQLIAKEFERPSEVEQGPTFPTAFWRVEHSQYSEFYSCMRKTGFSLYLTKQGRDSQFEGGEVSLAPRMVQTLQPDLTDYDPRKTPTSSHTRVEVPAEVMRQHTLSQGGVFQDRMTGLHSGQSTQDTLSQGGMFQHRMMGLPSGQITPYNTGWINRYR